MIYFFCFHSIYLVDFLFFMGYWYWCMALMLRALLINNRAVFITIASKWILRLVMKTPYTKP